MACAHHHAVHCGGFRCRLYFLIHCGIGRVAEQTGRKSAFVEIHPAQFLDSGIWRGGTHGPHDTARTDRQLPRLRRRRRGGQTRMAGVLRGGVGGVIAAAIVAISVNADIRGDAAKES